MPIRFKKYYLEIIDKLKKINSGSVTTFSNLSIVSENRLLKLPKDISLRKGVILGCAFPTGAGMILKNISIRNMEKPPLTP